MIKFVAVCPDCKETVEKNIRIDAEGQPFWSCPQCGTFHIDHSWYKFIDVDECERIEQFGAGEGLYVLDTDYEIIGIASVGGELFSEDFAYMAECLEWLAGFISEE